MGFLFVWFPYVQGELIAESGTMSGGAGRPQRGRMCLGSSAPKGTGAADARAVAAELKAAEQQLEQVRQDRRLGDTCIVACLPAYLLPCSDPTCRSE